MNDPTTEVKMERKAWIPALAVVLGIGVLLGGSVWVVLEVGRAARLLHESETRMLALRHACRLVGVYVEKRGKWPRSWDELLTGAEEGGFAGGWSPVGPRLTDLVVIDFEADLKELREQDASEFAAIRPAPGGVDVNLIGEYEALLARIRGPAEWRELDKDGSR